MPENAMEIKVPEIPNQGHKVTKSITTLETERNRFEDKIEQFQNKLVPPPNEEPQADTFSDMNVSNG